MKNVNMNTVFCDIVPSNDNSSISLGNLGKVFHISTTENERELSQLSMSIFVSAMQNKGDNTGIDPDTIFSFAENYEIKVRLTETISGSFKDLDKFILNPSESADSNGLCKQTFSYTRLCLYPNISLPQKQERERFVIKLLIRRYIEDRTQDNGWIIQSIAPVNFDN